MLFKDKIEVSQKNFYALSIANFSTQTQAEDYATLVEQNGGMGEVFHQGEFFVLAGIYPNLAQAREVLTNFDGFDANILTFKVQEIKKDYRGKHKQIVCDLLQNFFKTFEQIFEDMLKLDEGKLSISAFKSNLANLCVQNQNARQTFATTKTGLKSHQITSICTQIDDVNAIVSGMIMSTKDEKLFSSLVKKCLFKIVLSNAKFAQEL